MSTLNISAYAGRTIDVLAFQGVRANLDSQLTQTLFGNEGGQICAGVQMLAQRWVLEFLTELGSMTYFPTRGCDFMTAVRTGRMHTSADVMAEFQLASVQVASNLQQEELSTTPSDERLASATLTSLNLLPGALQLTVQITSLAGDAREVLLPISTLGG